MLVIMLIVGLCGLSPANITRADSPSGNAIKFTWGNSQYGSVPAATFGNPSGDFTLEAWVRLDSNLHSGAVATKVNSFGQGYWLQYEVGSNRFIAAIGDSGSWQTVSALNAPVVGQWYHLAMTYAGTALAFYVDGVLQGTTTVTASYTGSNFTIGRDSAGWGNYWDGFIDELRYWSAARTPAEIRQNMYRELDSDAGLQAVYHLNESSGTSLIDSSGNGRNGILVNIAATDWRTSGALVGSRQALNFDGVDDYVNGGATSPAFTTNLTVEAWVRTTDTRVARDLVAWGSTDTCIGDNAQFRIDNGVLNFGMHDIHGALCGNYDNNWASVVAPSTMIATGNWTHVALVKSGSDISLYVNGQAVATGTINKTLSVDRLAIGSLFYAGSAVDDYLAGDLDEMRIWSVARTGDEIRENMFTTLKGTEANLAAYYRFDQFNAADQTVLYDVTTHNANGTLINMTSTADWVSSTAFNTWVGSDSTAWNTASNWSRNAAPVATDNVGVYYYSASGHDPAITADTACHSLVIGTGTVLDIAANVAVTGDWLSFDAFNQSAGAVTFSGGGTHFLVMPAVGYFNDLTVNSGVTLVEADPSDNVVVLGALTNHGIIRKSQTVTAGLQVFGLTNLDINVQTQGTLSALQVDRIDQPHPQENISGGGTFILDHYYTITPSGADYSAELCAQYTLDELGVLDGSKLRLCRWTGTSWSCAARGVNSATADNIICADNVTAFSDWVIGMVGPTAVTLTDLSATAKPIETTPLLILLATLFGLGGLTIALRRSVSTKHISD